MDDTQKNEPSKPSAKNRTVRKADQPVGLHDNNFPLNRACHTYYQATDREGKEK